MEHKLIASHKKPHLNDYIPFLVLASLLILPIIQAFHFNASFTQLAFNKSPAQIEPLNMRLSSLTNQTNESVSFFQVTPIQQNLEDTEQFTLERQKLRSTIDIPPVADITDK
ncbi:MAG: hypothetical protein ACFE89_12685 [Candidatus Hodarchaeota archaeon]